MDNRVRQPPRAPLANSPPPIRQPPSRRRRTPPRSRNKRRGYSVESLVCLNRTQGGNMVYRPLALVVIGSLGSVLALAQGSNAMLDGTRTSTAQTQPEKPQLSPEMR